MSRMSSRTTTILGVACCCALAAAAASSTRCGTSIAQSAELRESLASGTSVLFVRSLGDGSLGDVERCAFEAALQQSGRAVVVFSNDLLCNAEALPSGLWVVRYSYEELFNDYPALAAWYTGRQWDVAYRGAHLADASRLALLHTYGGIYMDTDMLSTRGGLDGLVNALGAEDPWMLNNAFLSFTPAHPFLAAAIADFSASFSPSFWGWNGPRLASRTWQSLAAPAPALNITILPPSVLYPVSYRDVGLLFRPASGSGSAGDLAPLCSARTLHLWNHEVGPRLAAATACTNAPGAQFGATVLGATMAGVCPNTLRTITSRCSPPEGTEQPAAAVADLYTLCEAIATTPAAAVPSPSRFPLPAGASAAAATPSGGGDGDYQASRSIPLPVGAIPLPVGAIPLPVGAIPLPVGAGGFSLSVWVSIPSGSPATFLSILAPGCNADAASPPPRPCGPLVVALSPLSASAAAGAAAPLLRASSSLVPGRFHHLALVADVHSQLRLYVDSVQQLQEEFPTPEHEAAAMRTGLSAADHHRASAPLSPSITRIEFSSGAGAVPLSQLSLHDASLFPSPLSHSEVAGLMNGARAAGSLPPPAAAAPATIGAVEMVNLDKDVEDWSAGQALMRSIPLLSRLPLGLHRLSGVSGAALDLPALLQEGTITRAAYAQIIDSGAVVGGDFLTAGALGCLLSHVAVWRKAVSSGQGVLVFEDDVAVHDAAGFDAGLSLLLSPGVLPADWDLLYFVNLVGDPVLPYLRPHSEHWWRMSGGHWGTYAYAVSPHAAAVLLEHVFPATAQVDKLMIDIAAAQGLAVYMARHPLPLRTDSSRNRASDIQRYAPAPMLLPPVLHVLAQGSSGTLSALAAGSTAADAWTTVLPAHWCVVVWALPSETHAAELSAASGASAFIGQTVFGAIARVGDTPACSVSGALAVALSSAPLWPSLSPADRASALKYEILARHGGVVVDAGSLTPLRPFDHLLGGVGAFVVREDAHATAAAAAVVDSSILGCVPGHAFASALVQGLRAAVLAQSATTAPASSLLLPVIFGSAYLSSTLHTLHALGAAPGGAATSSPVQVFAEHLWHAPDLSTAYSQGVIALHNVELPSAPTSRALAAAAGPAPHLPLPAAVDTLPREPVHLAALVAGATYAHAGDLRRDDPAVLGLVHPDWRGVRTAHYRVPVLATRTLEIRALLDERAVTGLLGLLSSLRSLRTLIVDGVLDGTAAFARRLHALRPDVELLVVVHSGPSSPDHWAEAPHVAAVLREAAATPVQSRAIARVAFVKHGMAQFAISMGAQASTLWNFPPPAAAAPATLQLAAGKVHIGVLGLGQHKNVATQVLAVCFLPNVVIHLTEAPSVPYLSACTAPIVAHGSLPSPDFAALLGSMTVNLHVSLSECFPNLVLESLAAGVPCISSASSPIYSLDGALEALLVVPAADDPAAILNATQRVLLALGAANEGGDVKARLLRLSAALRSRAAESWDSFLGPKAVAAAAAHPRATAVPLIPVPRALPATAPKPADDSPSSTPSYSYSFTPSRTSSYSFTPSPSPSASPSPSTSPSSSQPPAPAAAGINTAVVAGAAVGGVVVLVAAAAATYNFCRSRPNRFQKVGAAGAFAPSEHTPINLRPSSRRNAPSGGMGTSLIVKVNPLEEGLSDAPHQEWT